MQRFFTKLSHTFFGHPALEIGAVYARCPGCRRVYNVVYDKLYPLKASRAASIFSLSEDEL